MSPSNEPKLALPPIGIPKFNGEYLDRSRFHDLFVELVRNKLSRPVKSYMFCNDLFAVKRGTF